MSEFRSWTVEWQGLGLLPTVGRGQGVGVGRQGSLLPAKGMKWSFLPRQEEQCPGPTAWLNLNKQWVDCVVISAMGGLAV